MATWASLGEKIHQALEEARLLEDQQECMFEELHVGEVRIALQELLVEKRTFSPPSMFEDLELD